MRPILFEIPSLNLAFSSYFVMLSLGMLVVMYLSLRIMKHEGLNVGASLDAMICILLSILVGSRVLFVIENSERFRNPVIEALKFWEGGFVFYGGFILAIVVGLAFLKLRRVPILKFLDCLAVPLGLGIALGRIGCFLNGCCYGKAAALPWMVVFSPGSQPYNAQLKEGLIMPGAPCSLALHPTQLYAAAGGLVIFFCISFLSRRRRYDGQLWWSFVLLYAALRFIIELFRGDHGPVALGILNLPQCMSIVAFLLALFLLMRLKTSPSPA